MHAAGMKSTTLTMASMNHHGGGAANNLCVVTGTRSAMRAMRSEATHFVNSTVHLCLPKGDRGTPHSLFPFGFFLPFSAFGSPLPSGLASFFFVGLGLRIVSLMRPFSRRPIVEK